MSDLRTPAERGEISPSMEIAEVLRSSFVDAVITDTPISEVGDHCYTYEPFEGRKGSFFWVRGYSDRMYRVSVEEAEDR